MSRTERLLEIMLRLQTLQRFTAQEMAEIFSVSRRTMLRDLQALSELGIPLLAIPGPHGGYILLQKQRLLPFTLTEDEAIGIVLSYEALLEYADTPFATQSLSAITKVRQALPSEVVQRLDAMLKHIVITGAKRTYKAPLLSQVLHAAMDTVHLRVTYESRLGHSERVIYPFGLYAHDGLWYCGCFDYSRQKHISLRVDRISALQREVRLEKPLTIPIRVWLQTLDSSEERVLLLRATISKRGMKAIDWSLFGQNIAINEQGVGILSQELPEHELDFYAHRFLSLGLEAKIESPPELIKVIQEKAQEIVKWYGGM